MEENNINPVNFDSILSSIKKFLGISPDYKEFDPDIIAAINTAFFALWTLGIGPEEQPFKITDDSSVWTDFIEDGKVDMCRSYVFMKVKLAFDPPMHSFLIENMKEQLSEYEFRMMVGVDEYKDKESS